MTRTRLLLPLLVLGAALAAIVAADLRARAPQAGAPDLIVADIPDAYEWGTSGGMSAYTFATTSCNLGTVPLSWVSNTNQHPVIGGNLFRLKDGVLEQLGTSWVKHGFTALNGTLCGNCQPTPGDSLGVMCSDPYSASLNGYWSYLGPRSEINAYDGYFPYPPILDPPTNGVLDRRIQVPNVDVDPALNAGARYFAECQYVHPEDNALLGNGENNVSYREVTISGSTPPFNLGLVGPTVREKMAIEAWQAIDPSVSIAKVQFPNDGSMFVASRVYDQGNGTWKYVYVLYNRDSDRGARGLGIPVDVNTTISNRTFRDVDHHSGEPIQTTDWVELDGPVSTFPRVIGWACGKYSSDPSNPGLRWGNALTVTFVADTPPVTGQMAVLAFRGSGPAYQVVTTNVPQ